MATRRHASIRRSERRIDSPKRLVARSVFGDYTLIGGASVVALLEVVAVSAAISGMAEEGGAHARGTIVGAS
jgi:hypothetical protein